MKNEKSRRRLRTVIRWVGWVLLVQFLLINISAALYAYKFTHLYSIEKNAQPVSSNMLAKTWRLFAGPRFYKLPELTPPSFAYTTINFETKNKTKIEAWYHHRDSVWNGTVILFHGLTGNKSVMLHQADAFRLWGFDVLMVDDRGHGNSEGNTTTIGFREAEEVKLAYDYIRQKGEKRIYLWGFSMGAAQILKAVADNNLQPAGIILEMPFGSLQSHIEARMKRIGFPKEPFGSLITLWIGIERGFNGFNFNSIAYARKIHCPALLQYGSKDQLVSSQDVKDIYNAMPSAGKRIVEYEDANHESLLDRDPALWKSEVETFLNR